MDRNTKIAFGVFGIASVLSFYQIHRLNKTVRDLVTFGVNVNKYIDADFQEKVDKRFLRIVDNYEE